jgi:hypothetical protein
MPVLCPGVVLRLIDFVREFVLLLVHLFFLTLRQLSAVRQAIVLHFLVHCGFFRLQLSRFAGGQLTALDSLRDAVLLVLLTLANFALAVILCGGVVLVLINLLGKSVLLLVDLSFLLLGQRAAVVFPVGANFLVQSGFLRFQVRRFASSQLAALDSLRNAVLLIFFAIADRARGRRGLRCL